MFKNRDERGQATAEYALVLVGAAMVALLVFAWADGSEAVSGLLDRVIENVVGRIPKP